MNALDASVLFGFVETKDPRHEASVRGMKSLQGPCLTTEACLTEALYLAGARVGWRAQNRVWLMTDFFRIRVVNTDLGLARRLMERYRDVPMDFADATLVALASEDARVRVATFDSDFHAYRRDDGSPVPLVNDRLLG